MKPLTYETLLAHYELMDALQAQARRERARAFDRLIFSPVKAFARSMLNGSRPAGNLDIRRA